MMPPVVRPRPRAPGGSEEPIRGRAAVLAFFAAIYDALGDVRIVDYFFNEAQDAICVKADVGVKSGKPLRVADLFRINAEGKVIEHENHTIRVRRVVDGLATAGHRWSPHAYA
jgi:hypothetical protein